MYVCTCNLYLHLFGMSGCKNGDMIDDCVLGGVQLVMRLFIIFYFHLFLRFFLKKLMWDQAR